jgi:Zn finger protein HypA/HybF involved in hydrogenase expression
MSITERYPYARCEQCGWIGRISLLITGVGIEELCPECKSDDTTWLSSEEYVQELKETGHDDT